jgi:hypothetical protein
MGFLLPFYSFLPRHAPLRFQSVDHFAARFPILYRFDLRCVVGVGILK